MPPSKFKFKFKFMHLFTLIQLQYNNNKKKEVKTELTIYIELNIKKEKNCVAAKGDKLSSWLPAQIGYKWVEVIQCL